VRKLHATEINNAAGRSQSRL